MTEVLNKVCEWMKEHKRICKAVIMAFLPLLCCVIACAAQGKTISQVFIAAGEWNDELFYYKQVEGIVHYGYPQGYFGFNESHAQIGAFAAWSPVLLIPWILWGLVFGWNLSAPVYCNIFLMMLAVFLFVWMVKPNRKQLGILTLLFVTFTPLTRYMLSSMPECICFSMVIVVLALGISYVEEERAGKLVALFVMTAAMTLMRPYLLLFMLLPAWFWIRKDKVWGWIGTVGIVSMTGVFYLLISHYLCAEYFTPLFDTTWINTFFDQGLFPGVKYILWRLYHVGVDFFRLLVQGFRSDLFWGEYFAAFLVVFVVLGIQTVRNFRRREKKQFIVNLNLFVCSLGMLSALLLMYKMKEGSKHLLIFVVAGIFAVSLMETRFFKKAVAIAAVFTFLFTATGVDPYEHKIPFATNDLVKRQDYWQDVFTTLDISEDKQAPDYDNVMIWVFGDTVNGETVLTPYYLLYQLPEGFGISCCYADYVTDHLLELQSKYLAVAAGGDVDRICAQQKLREIGRDEGMVVYELHGEDE